jgi:hypothetical protein
LEVAESGIEFGEVNGTGSRYTKFLPTVAEWIRRTLKGYSGQKRSVASSVVVTHPLSVPPLSALGLSEFAAFESQSMSGITFFDTYFLLPGDAGEESLHFHELVHVIALAIWTSASKSINTAVKSQLRSHTRPTVTPRIAVGAA